MRRELAGRVDAGRLELCERVQVTGVEARAHRLLVRLSPGPAVLADAVWLATGGCLDVTRDPLCAPLVTRGSTVIAGGLPELELDLSWPGTTVHLTGFATALRLGPTAGNLVGHRRAALRIAAAVRGEDPDRADRIATGAGACPAGSAPDRARSRDPGSPRHGSGPARRSAPDRSR
jgi:hypothetical protein